MTIEMCRTDIYVTGIELFLFILDCKIQNGGQYTSSDFKSAKTLNFDLYRLIPTIIF